MKVTWIGQGGLLLRTDGATVMIDPYLSDCVGKLHPEKTRLIPVDEALFDITPEVLIFTHDHIDHYDPETAPRFLTKEDKAITVLCPASVWPKARMHRGPHNYVQFDSGTEWTEHGLRFTAVHAAHSDPHAIGVIVEELSAGKRYYITGDTLYNRQTLAELPDGIDVIFLPVNGVGNNMNAADAARLAAASGAEVAVPLHVGMMDGLTPDIFEAPNRLILKVYQETEI